MKKQWILLFGLIIACAGRVDAAKLSSYDRQIIASCMVLEAAGDGVEGMQAVLNVILTRADGYLHQLVPQTIKRGAFSCMAPIWGSSAPDYSPLLRRAQRQRNVYRQALQLISIMEQGRLWDNTYGATHYHAKSIRPYWVSDMTYIISIGGHHFYTDRGRRVASL